MVTESNAQDVKLAECIDNLKIMVYTAQIMENLMMDLLDLAQMENNTFNLNKDFFSFFEAIDQAFSVVSHLADQKQVRLEAPTCTASEAEYFKQLFGDKNRFIQVIINFVSNAVKFSEPQSKVKLNLKILEAQELDNPDFLGDMNDIEDDLAQYRQMSMSLAE